MMATHPTTIVSNIILIQLIYVSWLKESVSIWIHQPCSALWDQLPNEIRSAPIGSKLPSWISDQSSNDPQDHLKLLS